MHGEIQFIFLIFDLIFVIENEDVKRYLTEGIQHVRKYKKTMYSVHNKQHLKQHYKIKNK